VLLGPRPSQAAEPVVWLSGVELQKQLQRPMGLTWSGASLRSALERLARVEQVCIVLDRRIDPSKKIDLTLKNEPLDLALKRIAQQQGLGLSMLGSLAYLGPPKVAKPLRTLSALRREEALQAPAAARRKLLATRGWRWAELTSPRELLDQLAKEAGIEILEPERVLHDLWPAGDLPAMSWTDRLTLLAAEFDLTFQIEREGAAIRLIPFPRRVAIERVYHVPNAAAAAAARKWTVQLPEAQILAGKDTLTVLGLSEDQELIAAALQGRPAKRNTVTTGKQVYQLSVEKVPLKPLLAQLEKKLDLELHFDQTAIDRAGISLDQPVSVKVQNVSLDELLAAALQGRGLIYERKDRVVTISAK